MGKPSVSRASTTHAPFGQLLSRRSAILAVRQGRQGSAAYLDFSFPHLNCNILGPHKAAYVERVAPVKHLCPIGSLSGALVNSASKSWYVLRGADIQILANGADSLRLFWEALAITSRVRAASAPSGASSHNPLLFGSPRSSIVAPLSSISVAPIPIQLQQ